MNEAEKRGARLLLGYLETGDVLKLASTVTKSKLTTDTMNEAVDLILRYETDARSFLGRKKISVSVLTKYLHDNCVEFQIEESKQTLIERIVSWWNSNTPLRTIPAIENADRQAIKDSYTALPQDTPVDGSQATDNQVAVALSESDVNNLGVQFVNWFFSQLRGPDLELRMTGGEHFFSDALCRVCFGDNVQEGTGREACPQILFSCLGLFGPAVPVPSLEGVKSEMSPHGAVKVIACGTLHAAPARMLGAFEQAFLLARDPSTPDNWKIKYTELRIKSSSPQNQPNQIEPPHIPTLQQ